MSETYDKTQESRVPARLRIDRAGNIVGIEGPNGELLGALVVAPEESGTVQMGAAASELVTADTPAAQREAVGVARSPMSGRIMGVISHSFGARGWSTDGGHGYKTATSNAMIWALTKLGWPVVTPVDYVMVQSGKRLLGQEAGPTNIDALTLAAQMAAMDPKPDWVYFDCATNDVGPANADLNPSGTVANPEGLYARWKGPIDILLAAGIKVLLVLLAPVTDTSTSTNTPLRKCVLGANQLMRDAYAANPNCVLLDYYWYALDQTALTRTTLNPAWTPSGDNLHLNPVGGYHVGIDVFYHRLKNIYPFNSPIDWLIQHPYDVFASDNKYGNRLANGFLSGTAGTAGQLASCPLPTGQIADNWTMEHRAGDGNCVCSKGLYDILYPDGSPTGQQCSEQIFTFTGGTVADDYWFKQNTLTRGPAGASGEKGRYLACEIEVLAPVAGTISGLQAIHLISNPTSGGCSAYAFDTPTLPSQPLPQVPWSGTLRTPDVSLQQTTAVTITDYLQIKIAPGGTVVVKVRRITDRSSVPGTLLSEGVIA